MIPLAGLSMPDGTDSPAAILEIIATISFA
jgi:hypothetical protein